ncbi:MAG TPA: pyruvate kinase [Syntrophus sp. (in: bacteria)]|nr:pyruvate kinase [Syntrophus sp. (in: bacteria)]
MIKRNVKKKTKIVATISDRRCDMPFLKSLHQAGMDVVRLNTAHQTPEGSFDVIKNIRAVSDHIAIMVDTKGPEIRTTHVSGPIAVKKGDLLSFRGDPGGESSLSCVYVNYRAFVDETPLKSRILIDDGELELLVFRKIKETLFCEAQNDGVIEGHKSVNVPKVNFNLPSLSEKDLVYIQFCIDQDVDFIAHSFVRNKEDIISIQEILDKRNSPIKIIAKIENQSGVDHVDEILDYAYGIMVARGDLAIEIPYERIPGIQKMLINKCIARRKPVIIATQMLHSMIINPRPTRAEVSDIANAIYGKTDAIMLSGETTGGKYPLEAVCTMAKVAMEVEKSRSDIHKTPNVILTNDRSAYLTKTAVEAAVKLNAKAIIADTSSGNSIRNIAGFRGRKPVFAHCYDQHVVRQLSLSFGIFPEYIQRTESAHDFVHKALFHHLESGNLQENDLVVVLAGNFGNSFGPSFIEITPVSLFMTEKKIKEGS